MKSILIYIVLTFEVFASAAQVSEGYVVFLKDKNNNPYSIAYPQAFLSQRAIIRHAQYNIPYNEKDLPVTPSYINQIAATGAEVLYSLKWFNAVAIITDDPVELAAVETLPFVDHIRLATRGLQSSGLTGSGVNHTGAIAPYTAAPILPSSHIYAASSLDYGTAWNQVSMLGLQNLHDLGYTGQGMMIAILDAGFWDVDQGAAFAYLWENNLIKGTRDFVTPGGNVFIQHTHGESVLSVMGAYLPGQIIGTAPDAAYWLIRTEDAYGGEYLLEEYNWVAGAELADSAGADIITSSLAYTTFDNPAENHTYDDLDGNTTPVALGADFAASRGILVLNCAGNLGEDPWYNISTPADGDSVFAIGAVDESGTYTPFSGKGPTADGQIKPDVVAQGYNTAIIYGNGVLTVGTGTSFSTPLVSGALACLWQSVPGVSAENIRTIVRNTSSNSSSPDNFTGWGIPNIPLARIALLISVSAGETAFGDQDLFSLFPVPFFTHPILKTNQSIHDPVRITIYSSYGLLLHESYFGNGLASNIEISDFDDLPAGLYFIRVQWQKGQQILRAVKI